MLQVWTSPSSPCSGFSSLCSGLSTLPPLRMGQPDASVLHSLCFLVSTDGGTEHRLGEKCKNVQAMAPLTECPPAILHLDRFLPCLSPLLPSPVRGCEQLPNIPLFFPPIYSLSLRYVILQSGIQQQCSCNPETSLTQSNSDDTLCLKPYSLLCNQYVSNCIIS